MLLEKQNGATAMALESENTHLNRLIQAASTLRRWMGIELAPVGHAERIVSLAGGALAIFSLVEIERAILGQTTGPTLLIASMGASAVLLFAVPHGALSQPWAVIVGHLVSAIIGVACARNINDQTTAAALAVGLAIGAMHYLRAIHPPGGATALTAVVAGPDVHSLGYKFVITPVLLNATTIVALAILVNAAFSWRRYPAALGKPKPLAPEIGTRRTTHADFMAALRRMGTFIDIDEADFLQLEALTHEAASARSLQPEDIRLGAYYSNDALGQDWSVRRVIDQHSGPDGDTIIWKNVAGKERNQTGIATRADFARWAAFEVEPSERAWGRKKQ